MNKTTRSARGQIVDFNLLQIKEQISTLPKPTTVAVRETFIDQKMKRRIKKAAKSLTDQETSDTISPQPSKPSHNEPSSNQQDDNI